MEEPMTRKEKRKMKMTDRKQPSQASWPYTRNYNSFF